jgi:hypothetical protein
LLCSSVFILLLRTVIPVKVQKTEWEYILLYRVSQNWRTNGALRCRRDYRKCERNVKKILLEQGNRIGVRFIKYI